MPFKSEKQRKYLWANEPEIARDWTDTYGSRIHKDIGGIATLQDGYVNYTKGSDSVTVPKKFKARKDATPTHLAYITKAEAAQLKKQNKGTPHKGPEGIPSYDDYDATGGGYGRATSGSQMSAAETGGGGHGMSSGEAAQHRAAAQAAANMSTKSSRSQSDGILNKFNNWQNNYNTTAIMKHIQSKLNHKQIMKLVELGLVNYDEPTTIPADEGLTTDVMHLGGVTPTDLLSSGDSLKTLQNQFGYTGGMLNPADDRGEGQPYIYPTTTSVASAAESAGQSDLDKYLAGLGGDYLVPLPYVQNQTRAADGGRVPAAYGGIMDSYTGRRAYGFGSFFKSATKPFKKAAKGISKLAKSKLGKIALSYLATAGLSNYLAGAQGTFGLGAAEGQAWKGMKWLKPEMLAQNIGTTGTKAASLFSSPASETVQKKVLEEGLKKPVPWYKNPWVTIPGAATAAGLYTAKMPVEDLDDSDAEYDAEKAAFDKYLASLGEDNYRVPDEYILATGGRVGRQEGGLMDLGGMEKDYRNDGGFVPIGGQEKADDVPARLSRNEFVFTADAVRNAGGGDIDRGAEVMENVMKNLEGGGKISEESQGQGAQEMFEVSERLSEVM